MFFVKYCSVLLQALTVEADEDFLFALYDLTKIKGASWDMAQEEWVLPLHTISLTIDRLACSILLEHPEDVPEPQGTTSGQDLYFEVLELQPIKLSISFMRTERISSEEQ